MDTVFLQFAIEDTGQGLSPEELGILFQRFTQASPKTYGKYGYVVSFVIMWQS
jgi:signal transduction histidine kinase